MIEENINCLNLPIDKLKGIGPKKKQLFNKINIYTVWDLMYYFPRTYEDRRKFCKINECLPDELCCIRIRPLRQIIEKKIRPKLSVFILRATDGNEAVTIKWFSSPFSKPKLKSGTLYNVYGKMVSDKNGYEFEMRCMEEADLNFNTGRIVPIYHATAGITSKTISEYVCQALEYCKYLSDCLTDKIKDKYSLEDIGDAIIRIHNPKDENDIKNSHRRLAFEELFVLCIALRFLKSRRENNDGLVVRAAKSMREFADSLPYELTDGQKHALNDICADLSSGKQMNRLVQGDVGCGKTAVAAAVIKSVSDCGYQSVFMAPTEILAQQHYKTLCEMFGSDMKIALLTSSTKNKTSLLNDIKNGVYSVVVGTHAVIEKNVEFSNLALCITDEQHRFGVNQRALLSAKGINPHILVMSATPIPRTLSLILYGDLDISVIKTMPKHRVPTETFHVPSSKLGNVYDFVRKQVSFGRQCYIVCPLVDESDLSSELVSVSKLENELSKKIFPDLKTACIHGKMKAADKEEIMKHYKDGETDILISTTVIEVGVDVPNATVMVIVNAERFGLSQLHQLRGRVGRGKDKSYCILVSDCKTDNCAERMKIMTETNDGFLISQKDLELRGCGQFFGTKQHGLPELKAANLFSDIDLFEKAQLEAENILGEDPNLNMEKYALIKGRIDKLFEQFKDADIFN